MSLSLRLMMVEEEVDSISERVQTIFASARARNEKRQLMSSMASSVASQLHPQASFTQTDLFQQPQQQNASDHPSAAAASNDGLVNRTIGNDSTTVTVTVDDGEGNDATTHNATGRPPNQHPPQDPQARPLVAVRSVSMLGLPADGGSSQRHQPMHHSPAHSHSGAPRSSMLSPGKVRAIDLGARVSATDAYLDEKSIEEMASLMYRITKGRSGSALPDIGPTSATSTEQQQQEDLSTEELDTTMSSPHKQQSVAAGAAGVGGGSTGHATMSSMTVSSLLDASGGGAGGVAGDAATPGGSTAVTPTKKSGSNSNKKIKLTKRCVWEELVAISKQLYRQYAALPDSPTVATKLQCVKERVTKLIQVDFPRTEDELWGSRIAASRDNLRLMKAEAEEEAEEIEFAMEEAERLRSIFGIPSVSYPGEKGLRRRRKPPPEVYLEEDQEKRNRELFTGVLGEVPPEGATTTGTAMDQSRMERSSMEASRSIVGVPRMVEVTPTRTSLKELKEKLSKLQAEAKVADAAAATTPSAADSHAGAIVSFPADFTQPLLAAPPNERLAVREKQQNVLQVSFRPLEGRKGLTDAAVPLVPLSEVLPNPEEDAPSPPTWVDRQLQLIHPTPDANGNTTTTAAAADSPLMIEEGPGEEANPDASHGGTVVVTSPQRRRRPLDDRSGVENVEQTARERNAMESRAAQQATAKAIDSINAQEGFHSGASEALKIAAFLSNPVSLGVVTVVVPHGTQCRLGADIPTPCQEYGVVPVGIHADTMTWLPITGSIDHSARLDRRTQRWLSSDAPTRIEGIQYVDGPQHIFALTKPRVVTIPPYYISRSPVTVKQYRKMLADRRVNGMIPLLPGNWLERRQIQLPSMVGKEMTAVVFQPADVTCDGILIPPPPPVRPGKKKQPKKQPSSQFKAHRREHDDSDTEASPPEAVPSQGRDAPNDAPALDPILEVPYFVAEQIAESLGGIVAPLDVYERAVRGIEPDLFAFDVTSVIAEECVSSKVSPGDLAGWIPPPMSASMSKSSMMASSVGSAMMMTTTTTMDGTMMTDAAASSSLAGKPTVWTSSVVEIPWGDQVRVDNEERRVKGSSTTLMDLRPLQPTTPPCGLERVLRHGCEWNSTVGVLHWTGTFEPFSETGASHLQQQLQHNSNHHGPAGGIPEYGFGFATHVLRSHSDYQTQTPIYDNNHPAVERGIVSMVVPPPLVIGAAPTALRPADDVPGSTPSAGSTVGQEGGGGASTVALVSHQEIATDEAATTEPTVPPPQTGDVIHRVPVKSLERACGFIGPNAASMGYPNRGIALAAFRVAVPATEEARKQVRRWKARMNLSTGGYVSDKEGWELRRVLSYMGTPLKEWTQRSKKAAVNFPKTTLFQALQKGSTSSSSSTPAVDGTTLSDADIDVMLAAAEGNTLTTFSIGGGGGGRGGGGANALNRRKSIKRLPSFCYDLDDGTNYLYDPSSAPALKSLYDHLPNIFFSGHDVDPLHKTHSMKIHSRGVELIFAGEVPHPLIQVRFCCSALDTEAARLGLWWPKKVLGSGEGNVENRFGMTTGALMALLRYQQLKGSRFSHVGGGGASASSSSSVVRTTRQYQEEFMERFIVPSAPIEEWRSYAHLIQTDHVGGIMDNSAATTTTSMEGAGAACGLSTSGSSSASAVEGLLLPLVGFSTSPFRKRIESAQRNREGKVNIVVDTAMEFAYQDTITLRTSKRPKSGGSGTTTLSRASSASAASVPSSRPQSSPAARLPGVVAPPVTTVFTVIVRLAIDGLDVVSKATVEVVSKVTRAKMGEDGTSDDEDEG